MVAGVDLIYNTGASALQMAQQIFGAGTTIVGASYTGDSSASAIYSGGNTISPGVVPGDSGVILSTGQATRFTNQNAFQSNLSNSTTSSSSGPNNVPQFNQIAGTQTYDASYLDIDFIPDPGVNAVSINFVFSSDEFPEYSNSIYNDIIGVWSNGQLVPISVGNGDVSVGNINQNDTQNLFLNNTGDQFNTEMDGFTLTLSLTIPVTPGQVNSLRIGIADVADSNYDSNLLIAADSVQGNLVAIDDTQTIALGGTKTVDPLANDINQTGGVLTITHINGIPVVAGDTVTLTTGQSVTLNANGTFTVTTDFDIETINFTYNVDSTTGDSDVGIVTIDTVPCFVAGTTVLTPGGEVPVEQLSPGDLVITKDDGAQPVRWTGRRSVHAVGSFSPVLLESGAIGNYRALMVSPQHRVLINSARAELLFGDAEVLVAAGHLTNGRDIHQVEGGTVEYVHILFDRHQIVFSEGVLTESFLPGPQTGNCYEAEVLAELVTLFPELDPTTGLGYGPAARRVLKSFEVRALLAA